MSGRRFVMETFCPEDVLSGRRFVWDTLCHCPGDIRYVRETLCPSISMDFSGDFSHAKLINCVQHVSHIRIP